MAARPGNASCNVSEDTGINEVRLDPRDPNVMYASAYQRRRHVWTLVNGGPESAIYKTTDGGQNWRKLTEGIPGSGQGPHRPGDRPGQSGHPLRAHRGGRGQRRRVSLDEPRGKLGETQQLR